MIHPQSQQWSYLHPKLWPDSKGGGVAQRKFWVLLPKEGMGLGSPKTRNFHFNMSKERETDKRLVELEMREVTSGKDCPSVDYLCQEVLSFLLQR